MKSGVTIADVAVATLLEYGVLSVGQVVVASSVYAFVQPSASLLVESCHDGVSNCLLPSAFVTALGISHADIWIPSLNTSLLAAYFGLLAVISRSSCLPWLQTFAVSASTSESLLARSSFEKAWKRISRGRDPLSGIQRQGLSAVACLFAWSAEEFMFAQREPRQPPRVGFAAAGGHIQGYATGTKGRPGQYLEAAIQDRRPAERLLPLLRASLVLPPLPSRDEVSLQGAASDSESEPSVAGLLCDSEPEWYMPPLAKVIPWLLTSQLVRPGARVTAGPLELPTAADSNCQLLGFVGNQGLIHEPRVCQLKSGGCSSASTDESTSTLVRHHRHMRRKRAGLGERAIAAGIAFCDIGERIRIDGESIASFVSALGAGVKVTADQHLATRAAAVNSRSIAATTKAPLRAQTRRSHVGEPTSTSTAVRNSTAPLLRPMNPSNLLAAPVSPSCLYPLHRMTQASGSPSFANPPPSPGTASWMASWRANTVDGPSRTAAAPIPLSSTAYTFRGATRSTLAAPSASPLGAESSLRPGATAASSPSGTQASDLPEPKRRRGVSGPYSSADAATASALMADILAASTANASVELRAPVS